MDTQQLRNYIKTLDPEYQDFLRSGYLEEVATVFSSEQNRTEEDRDLLANNLLFFAAFLFNETDLASAISSDWNITETDAVILTKALLQSFSSEFLAKHTNTYNLLNAKETSPQTSIPINSIQPVTAAEAMDLDAEIAATEAAYQETLQPMRTMAGDAAVAQGATEKNPHAVWSPAVPEPAISNPTDTLVPAPTYGEQVHQAAGQEELLGSTGNAVQNTRATWPSTPQ